MPSLFPAWTSICGFILGAFLGSFLNMAIYRLPRELSFVNPSRSFCPKCKHPLASMDLMPIFSWIFAGGKCRYCKDNVSSRYLWVELLTGSLFAAIWWRFLVESYEPVRATAYLLTTCCLVAIIFIDAELFIIPDQLNALILIIAIIYRWSDHSLNTVITGGLLGWGLLFGVQLLGRLMFKKDAMGDGDIKMMRSVGALLGPTLLIGNFGIAVVIGLIGGLIGIAIANRAEKSAVNGPDGHPATAGNQSTSSGELANEDEVLATPIPLMLLSGVWYLLCLDVVGLAVPPLRKWVESKFPQELIDEEDDWKPSVTTIPFGPYLAAGALACMMFAGSIEGGLKSYFRVPGVDPGPALLREMPTRLN